MATHSNIPAVLHVISVSIASLKPSHSASLWFLPGEPRASARGKPGSQAEQRPWWVDTGAQLGMEKVVQLAVPLGIFTGSCTHTAVCKACEQI